MEQNILEQLEDYSKHTDSLVSETATNILSLVKEVEDGNLSVEEFEELAQDVAGMAKLSEHIGNISGAAMREEALRMLASLVPQVAKVLK